MVNVEEVSVEEVSVDDDLTVSDKEGVADPSIFKSLESCMSSENEEDLIAFVDKMLVSFLLDYFLRPHVSSYSYFYSEFISRRCRLSYS